MKSKFKHYLLILLKGFGMGSADVVPGVSGGTIAFITGIYEELINSIKSIDIDAIKLFLTGKWKPFWKHINGNFLLSVFIGILLAVVSMAKILENLLNNYPILIWSFFFGLILISSYTVARRIKNWDYARLVAIVSGVGAAFYITSVTPAETSDASVFIFLSGVLAICAMILPGISGSFILLLLGKYEFALNAVNELEVKNLLLLASGALVGLLSLSRFLSWLFNKYHDVTIALLAGFMIGSLNKIWPWKETVETIIIKGIEKPLIQKNILPSFGQSSDQLLWAILMMLSGFCVILFFELAFKQKEKT